MRLVCPNCGAQYEVDDRVIPDGGRDVQCSSCGHAWYQMPAHLAATQDPASAEPEEIAETDDDILSEVEPEPETRPDGDAETEASAADEAEVAEVAVPDAPAEPVEAASPPQPAPEPPAEPAVPDAAPEVDDAAPQDDDTPHPAAGEGAPPPRRDLDENLRAILQEEAARELAARASAREPQPDTAQPGRDAVPAAAAARNAFAEQPEDGFDDDTMPDIGPAPESERGAGGSGAPAWATADKAPRRDLFPDIEEINSTLDSHGPEEEVEIDETAEGRGGFGRGFFAIIFIAALALAIYLVAPRLAETVPALEPALTAYVGAVNGAREWLDAMLQGVTSRIDSAE